MDIRIALITIGMLIGLLAVASAFERIDYHFLELKVMLMAQNEPDMTLIRSEPGDRPLAVCSHCGEPLHFHTNSERLVVECQACDIVLFRYYNQKKRAA